MSSSVNPHYWFNLHLDGQAAPDAPSLGALVYKDESTLFLDFKVSTDRNRIYEDLRKDSVGLALFSGIHGLWSVTLLPKKFPSSVFSVHAQDESLEQAVALAFGEIRKFEEAERMVRDNPELHLERELASHDWFYHNSDDHTVFVRGEAQGRLIQEILQKVTPEAGRFLWEKYAPPGWGLPA